MTSALCSLDMLCSSLNALSAANGSIILLGSTVAIPAYSWYSEHTQKVWSEKARVMNPDTINTNK